MRNEILKDPNPIGSYILESERNHVAEPITRRDAEMTYGHSLMGLMTLSRAMDTALNLVDTGAGSTRKMKGYSSSQTLLRTTPSGQNTKNSWNLFLKANKGKYRGPIGKSELKMIISIHHIIKENETNLSFFHVVNNTIFLSKDRYRQNRRTANNSLAEWRNFEI